eukprot:2651315-Rhodomonas_salina.3
MSGTEMRYAATRHRHIARPTAGSPSPYALVCYALATHCPVLTYRLVLSLCFVPYCQHVRYPRCAVSGTAIPYGAPTLGDVRYYLRVRCYNPLVLTWRMLLPDRDRVASEQSPGTTRYLPTGLLCHVRY